MTVAWISLFFLRIVNCYIDFRKVFNFIFNALLTKNLLIQVYSNLINWNNNLWLRLDKHLVKLQDKWVHIFILNDLRTQQNFVVSFILLRKILIWSQQTDLKSFTAFSMFVVLIKYFLRNCLAIDLYCF